MVSWIEQTINKWNDSTSISWGVNYAETKSVILLTAVTERILWIYANRVFFPIIASDSCKTHFVVLDWIKKNKTIWLSAPFIFLYLSQKNIDAKKKKHEEREIIIIF